MSSWLDILTDSTKELEPPERFFWWAGLAAIAAIVKKNVFLNRFSYILYPNIYVVLVSSRSGLRKGIPINYAKSIVNHLDCTRIISGQNSLPDIIKDLSTQYTTKTGNVFSDAQALLCASELDSFLLKDELALTTLTDLYDTHSHEDGWRKGLKSGREDLKNPCINMLGASNEVLFEDMVKYKDIEGGFLARTFIVHESKRRRNNSLMWAPQGLIPKADLAEHLRRLVNLAGVFEIPDPVKHHYDDWYNDISTNGFEDRTGTIDRIGDSVLKVAMLIQLAKGNNLVIDKDSMDEAINKCESSLVGTQHVSLGHSRSDVGPIMAVIIKVLIDACDQELPRAKILDKCNCEPIQFDRAIDTLIQREVLEEPFRKRLPNGKIQGGLWYRMRKEVYLQYLKIKAKP